MSKLNKSINNLNDSEKTFISKFSDSIRSIVDFRDLRNRVFRDKKNLDSVFGYPDTVTYEDLNSLRDRLGIFERLLDKPASATWGIPPDIEVDNDSDEFLNAWNDIVQNHNIWKVLYSLDKMAAMDDYAILLIVFEGDTDLSAPLSELKDNSLRKIAYIQQYPATRAKIDSYINDRMDPRYGLPEYYRIKNKNVQMIGSSLNSETFNEIKIHYSRVLHVAENALEDSLFGTPRMKRHFNTLLDYKKAVGGAAEIFWNAAYNGFQVDIPPDIEVSPEKEKQLSDEVKAFYSNFSRFIKTKGVEIKPLGGNTVDPTGLIDVLITTLAIEAEIPKRILIGTEAGELSSEQDRANFARVVKVRQLLFAESVVLNPLVRLLFRANVLPHTSNLKWKWEDAFTLNPLEKGRRAYDMARSAANIRMSLEPMVNRMLQQNSIGRQKSSGEIDKNSNTQTLKDAILDVGIKLEGDDFKNVLVGILTENVLRTWFDLDDPRTSFDDSDDIKS